MIALICLFLGIFWSILPVLGWSHYSLEGILVSCSIEWDEKSFAVQSYNITVFIFVYLIPMAIIIVFNYRIFIKVNLLKYSHFLYYRKLFLKIKVKRIGKLSENINTPPIIRKNRFRREKRLTIIIIILIGSLLFVMYNYLKYTSYFFFN